MTNLEPVRHPCPHCGGSLGIEITGGNELRGAIERLGHALTSVRIVPAEDDGKLRLYKLVPAGSSDALHAHDVFNRGRLQLWFRVLEDGSIAHKLGPSAGGPYRPTLRQALEDFAATHRAHSRAKETRP